MKYLPLLLLILLSLFAQAQEEEPEANTVSILHSVTIPSGGDAYSNGGSVAYSIGQVLYLSHSDSENSINEGIQHPLMNASEEASPVVEKFNPAEEPGNSPATDINIIAYPNPMTEFLIVEITNFKAEGYSYQLFDLHGRLLKMDVLENRSTKIRPNNLESAMYILKVFKQNQNIETFKIIKR
jgi:hypothetical protein